MGVTSTEDGFSSAADHGWMITLAPATVCLHIHFNNYQF